MNATAVAAMTEASEASDAERLTFPQVVKLLMDAGVERYHTDMMRGEKTYYMPDGESHIVPGDKFDLAAPAAFSAAGVEAAVRAIQQGKTIPGILPPDRGGRLRRLFRHHPGAARGLLRPHRRCPCGAFSPGEMNRGTPPHFGRTVALSLDPAQRPGQRLR